MYKQLEKEARHIIRQVLSLGNTLNKLLIIWTNFDEYETFILNNQNDSTKIESLKQYLNKCLELVNEIQNIEEISPAVIDAAEKKYKKLQSIVENVCVPFITNSYFFIFFKLKIENLNQFFLYSINIINNK